MSDKEKPDRPLKAKSGRMHVILTRIFRVWDWGTRLMRTTKRKVDPDSSGESQERTEGYYAEEAGHALDTHLTAESQSVSQAKNRSDAIAQKNREAALDQRPPAASNEALVDSPRRVGDTPPSGAGRKKPRSH